MTPIVWLIIAGTIALMFAIRRLDRITAAPAAA